jgi:pyruvate dehydrogenase E1 component beta subunit
VKGLLAAAIRDDNPVIFLEDRTLGLRREHVPDEAYVIPLGKADVKRVGGDATVVTVGGSLVPALEAALDFEGRGTSIEVIDVRTLVPLDIETILSSVAKTGRLVVVDPAHGTCSAASEIAAHVAEDAFDSLRAPIVRVTTPDVPIPFSPPLERPLYPDKARIMTALERVLGGGSNK